MDELQVFGTRSFRYVGASVGSSALIVAFTVSFAPAEELSIGQGAYAAAAQVTPVLMLAALLGMGNLRRLIVRADLRLEKRWVELEADLLSERDTLPSDAQPERRERLGWVLDRVGARERFPRKSTRTAAEVTSGALITTLLLGSAGIGCSLVALALEHDSPGLAMATALGVVWVMVGLVVIEVTHYALSGGLEPNDDVMEELEAIQKRRGTG